ncbi:MAG: SurA N-terminal domain-containing protein [Patescibacteria group bacterium]
MNEPMTPPSPTPSTSAAPSVSRRKTMIIVGVAVAVVLIAVLGLGVAVSSAVFASRSDSGLIRGLSSILPIPAAKVGSRTVLYRDFLKTCDTVKAFIASDAAKEQGLNVPFDATLEKNAFEKLIRQAAIEEFAAETGIEVTDAELRAFFTDVVAAASSTTPDVGVYLLENFGWNEEDFRQNVLKPALLEQRVGTKLTEEAEGDTMAFTAWLEERLAKPDVVRYVRFE